MESWMVCGLKNNKQKNTVLRSLVRLSAPQGLD